MKNKDLVIALIWVVLFIVVMSGCTSSVKTIVIHDTITKIEIVPDIIDRVGMLIKQHEFKAKMDTYEECAQKHLDEALMIKCRAMQDSMNHYIILYNAK